MTGLIDMGSKEGTKLFYKAIRPLDEDTSYDCQPDGLKAFLDDLGDRALDFGWNKVGSVLQIPDDHTNPTQNCKSLLTNYGELTMAKIKKYEESYIDAQTRTAQDNRMLSIQAQAGSLFRTIAVEGDDS